MKGIDMEKITRMDDPEWVSLVDNAARGSIDAATKLAEAYTTDRFGEADFLLRLLNGQSMQQNAGVNEQKSL